nr:polysaccharide biosynthesis tyrosine autokinase [Agromyces seonyuensis]
MADAAESSELYGVVVDVDPTVITTDLVLGPASDALGVPQRELASTTTVTLGDTLSAIITIETTADSPAASRARADTIAKSYDEYLQSETARVLTVLQEQQAAAQQAAIDAEKAATAAPDSAIAQTQLVTAIGANQTAKQQVTDLTADPPPTKTLFAAEPGVRLGTSPLTIILIAFAASLIAAIGIALARDQFDNRLRGEEEIEDLTSLPSIGVLSLDRGVARAQERLPAASRRRTAISEDLRALRTSLQVVLPRRRGILVITSVEPGDGKTFIAANLALAWARAGRKVVLVAGDLRRPALDEYFSVVSGLEGLADLLDPELRDEPLTGEAVLKLLAPSGHPNLLILPPGAEPIDPADLLAGPDLSTVFAALREAADIVIVDSPPAMAITDASLFAGHADGVLVIASVRRTDRAHLTRTVDTLQANGAPLLGVVVNRAKRRVPKSYSPYYVQRSQTAGDRRAAMAQAATAPEPEIDEHDALPEEPESETTAAPTPPKSSAPKDSRPSGPGRTSAERGGTGRPGTVRSGSDRPGSDRSSSRSPFSEPEGSGDDRSQDGQALRRTW